MISLKRSGKCGLSQPFTEYLKLNTVTESTASNYTMHLNLGYQNLMNVINMINTIKKLVHVEYFATSACYRLWFNVVVKNVQDLFIQVVM